MKKFINIFVLFSVSFILFGFLKNLIPGEKETKNKIEFKACFSFDAVLSVEDDSFCFMTLPKREDDSLRPGEHQCCKKWNERGMNLNVNGKKSFVPFDDNWWVEIKDSDGLNHWELKLDFQELGLNLTDALYCKIENLERHIGVVNRILYGVRDLFAQPKFDISAAPWWCEDCMRKEGKGKVTLIRKYNQIEFAYEIGERFKVTNYWNNGAMDGGGMDGFWLDDTEPAVYSISFDLVCHM